MIYVDEGKADPIRVLLIAAMCLAMALPASAGIPAQKQAWQFKWKVWMASNWKSVAQCETGTNFSHSNSKYVSAFGIQRGNFRGAYDDDARRVGAPAWSDKKPPTPWQQYRTAISHYKEFGDGWGCPGP